MAKKFRSKKTKYSFMKILTGSDLSIRRLAIMETKSDNQGPVVWLTGCVHGDEVGGIVIIQEIFKRLKKYPLKQGSVFAFPMMNPIGFEAATRNIILSEEDLNRSFPGDKNGSLAERMAEKIFSTIIKTDPALVIDIHNDWIHSIPYTLLDPYPGLRYRNAYEKARKYSSLTGFLVINEKESGEEAEQLKKTLSGSLILHNVPAVTVEVGGANLFSNIYNEKDIRDAVKSIWNILEHLGMVEPVNDYFNYQMPEKYKNKILRYSHQPVSSTSGLIRFMVKPGQFVAKGQSLARVYNVFGKLQENIVATNDAIILGHTDYSISYPGAEVLAFALI